MRPAERLGARLRAQRAAEAEARPQTLDELTDAHLALRDRVGRLEALIQRPIVALAFAVVAAATAALTRWAG